ncbi:hypothetical protein E2P81_ATG05452 [Venturia nashicola]|nr:hypothetical protein E2P81_ATG05452 [Venturia nashicola]
MLEPESLAIFQPFIHNAPQLDLRDLSNTEKDVCYAYEGKNIVDDDDPELKGFDLDLNTRNISIGALILALAIGMFSLVLGARIITSGKVLLPSFLLGKYTTVGNTPFSFPITTAKHYFSGHRAFSMPEAAVLSASLAVNILLTLLFESMNYIQKCTLRWALWREGRLQYNSNPRLFSSARQYIPNSWSINVISCVALILGYGSTATLTSPVNMVGISDPKGRLVKPVVPQGWALDINAWCLCGLGMALLLQGLICSWCLARSQHVLTWSSNPLNTARICHVELKALTASNLQRSHLQVGIKPSMSLTSRSIPSSPPSMQLNYLTVPLLQQPSMRTRVTHAKHLAQIIWIVFFVVAIWTIVIGALGKQSGTCSANYVRTVSPVFDFLSFWQKYCRFVARFSPNAYTDRRDWLGLVVHSLILAFVSLGLHCAEVITEMARDEAIWRKATTSGASPTIDSSIQGALSWQCWVLFAFKCVVPWIFGYALETSVYVITSLLPLLTLAILLLLLGLLVEILIRHKPKGPQPTTYGDIEALAALIDDWQDGKIFWGDKGPVTEMIRRAGTSGQRLAGLQMSFLYQGLRG